MAENNFLGVLRVESEIGQLEISLRVSLNYALNADDTEALRRLIPHEPDCTARWLYQTILTLIPGEPSSDDISIAIAKIAWVRDGQIFRSALWWQGIAAFKKFDELTSADIVN